MNAWMSDGAFHLKNAERSFERAHDDARDNKAREAAQNAASAARKLRVLVEKHNQQQWKKGRTP